MPTMLRDSTLFLNLVGLIMDRDRIYAFIKKITPMYWFTRASTKFIKQQYPNRNLIGAEIGVDYGLNAKTILTFLPIKKFYLIDPYTETLDSISGDKRFLKAQKLLVKFDKKIQFIRKTSEEAVKDLPDDIDFIYIDGRHEYKSVKKDIELYYSKVRKGGFIGGHDFWGNEIGVCKAAIEFAQKNNLNLQGAFTDWWVIKY
jgi:hypothetical protein